MLMPSLRLMLELLPPTVDMPPPTDAMVLIVLATLLPPPTLLPVTAASMAGATCTRGRPMLRLMPDLPVPTFPVVPPATSTEAPRAPEDSMAVPSMVLATSTAEEACTRGPLMPVTSTGSTDLSAVASRECTDPLPPTLLASTTNIAINTRQNYLFPKLP